MRDFAFIWPLLRHRAGWLLLACLLALLTALSGLGLLAVAGWLLASVALVGAGLVGPNLLLRLLALSRTAGRYADRVISHEATFRLLADLRVWFYARLAPLSPGALARFHSGDLLNRLVADIQSLDNLFLRVLLPSISAAVVGTGVLLLLAYWSWFWALMVVACLVLAGVVLPAISGRLGAESGAALSQQLAGLRHDVVDSVNGLAELLIYGASQRQLDRLSSHQQAFLATQQRMNRLQAISVAVQTLLAGLALWLLVFLGARLVSDGVLSGSLLVGLALVVLAAFEVFQPLPMAYQYLGQTRASARRLEEIINTEPAVRFVAHSRRSPGQFDIELRDVSFAYQPEQPVLQAINVQVAAGERVAVVGPSGAGKSTLAQLLVRFFDPDQGTIDVGGVPLSELAEGELRNLVGMVSQRSHLFSGTLRQNLLMARPDAGEPALLEALRGARLDTFISKLPDGLDTWLGEAGMALSGGQIRRLAVARMLLRDPPILVLDEPTEGLDAFTAGELLQTLNELMANRTVILITHRLQDLAGMDRVILLDAGRVLGEGSIADMLGRYPQLAELGDRLDPPC